MSNGFQFYEGTTSDSASTPKITVRKGGVLILTKAVVDMLGPAPSTDSVQGLVQAHIDEVNDTLARHETIKRFVTIDTPLTVENGLLTASLKTRRKKIYETFRTELEALYGEPA